MPGYVTKLSDEDLLDMVEGLRYPTTLERELAVRWRRRLEAETERGSDHESKRVFNHDEEKQK